MSRKGKKILYHSPSIWGNTDFYRTTGVLPFINHPELSLRDISHFGKVSQWDLEGSDIIIVQRPCTPDHLKLIQLAKQCGLKVVIENDDDVLNVDKYNPTYLQYEAQRDTILNCFDMADEMWVSTKAISDSFGRGIIIPNALNNHLLDKCLPFNSDSNRVVWRGGSSHEADIYENADFIVDMVNSNPKLDFYFIGHRFTYLEQRLGDNFTSVHGMQIMRYFSYLRELKPRAMIFPLCDTILNRGKSNISLLEATWCGAEYFGNTMLPEFNMPFSNSLDMFPNGCGHKSAVEYVESERLLSQINWLRVNSLLSL